MVERQQAVDTVSAPAARLVDACHFVIDDRRALEHVSGVCAVIAQRDRRDFEASAITQQCLEQLALSARRRSICLRSAGDCTA